MDVIKNLWYGNICGVDDCNRDTPPEHTDYETYVNLRNALTTQEQQDLLDAYVDAIHQSALDWQEQAFRYGIRLGFHFAAEIGARQE